MLEAFFEILAIIVLLLAGLGIAILFLNVFLGAFFQKFNYQLYDLTGVSLSRFTEFHLRRLPHHKERLLHQNSSYYRRLGYKQKRKFGSRVRKFINEKDFIGRGGLTVTEEMQLLIAAQAIMLSFGMRDYLLEKFSRIFVYPHSYFSNVTGNYHKGEVNPGGAIVLSWDNFAEGIEDEKDNRNLGLHEFAHAYFLEAQTEEEYGELSMVTRMNNWYRLYNNHDYKNELQAVQAVREYAFTNPLEFFAVSVEYFFETPETFSQKAPRLYTLLSEMLNQNPLRQFK